MHARRTPAATTRRPPEPLRPFPPRNPGITLIGNLIRRRRFRHLQPPGRNE